MPLQASVSAAVTEVTHTDRNPFRNRESDLHSRVGVSQHASSTTVRPETVTARSPGSFPGAESVNLYGSNQFNHAQGSIIHIHNQASRNQPSVSPLPGSYATQNSVKTYTRLMMLQGNGYPLWNPKPPDDLPMEYTREGVRIGDVGVVTSDGVFDFVFNIYYSADHPINRGRTPPDFIPFSAYFSTRHDRRRWRPRSQLVSPAIGSSIDAEGARYYFQCSGSEGAVLALPEGASRDEARELANFRDYASRHAIGWYQYLIRRGWEIPNGSLYLITGCDKTASWGTAAFNRNVSSEFRMLFAPERYGINDHSYCWEESGYAETNTGQSSHLLEQNQCIFLRGFKATLQPRFWAELSYAVEVTSISETNKGFGHYISSCISFLPMYIWLLGYFGPKEPFTRSFWDPKIDALENSIHPPDVINFDLLRRVPDAKLALTHDSEYHSLGNIGGHGTLPSSSDEILARVYEKYIIEQRGGVVYLVKKDLTDVTSSLQGLTVGDSQVQGPVSGERERLLPGPSISPPRYLLDAPRGSSSSPQPPATSTQTEGGRGSTSVPATSPSPSSEPQQPESSTSQAIPSEATQPQPPASSPHLTVAQSAAGPPIPPPLPSPAPAPNQQRTPTTLSPALSSNTRSQNIRPPAVAGPSTSRTTTGSSRGAYTSRGSSSRGGYGSVASTSGPTRGSSLTSRGRGGSSTGTSSRGGGQARGGAATSSASAAGFGFFSFGFASGAAGAAAGAAPIAVFGRNDDDSDDSDSSDSSSDDSDSS